MTTRIRTRLTKLGAVATAAMVLTIAVSVVALAATMTNGGFETGTFSGWTVVNLTGSSGNWFNYTGTTSPSSGHTIPAPPEGTRAATTDQTGPGSHELYQDVVLQPGFTHTLTFSLYYHAYSPLTAKGRTLDFNGSGGPNMQYRVDVMKTTAPDFSIAATDVLANVFQTDTGDPLVVSPTTKMFDLTPFAGQTVRLRYAEVDNQLFFNAGVDNVQVVSTQADLALKGTTSPEPVTTGSNLTYVLTAKNNGPDPALSTVLNQTLAAQSTFVSASPSQGSCTTPAVGSSGTISCAFGTLANAASATLTVTVKVTAPGGSTISTSANVASAVADPNPGDNAASSRSTVAAVPTLPKAGAPSTYRGEPGNGGPLLGLLMMTGLGVAGALAWRLRRVQLSR
jgi:uncharacterized repeat protein (TIGR01451 family)